MHFELTTFSIYNRFIQTHSILSQGLPIGISVDKNYYYRYGKVKTPYKLCSIRLKLDLIDLMWHPL